MQSQQTIGIVGGGQLGRMLTLAALPLGFRVVVINPTDHSPAAQVGAEEITADLYDGTALKQLAEQADYLTIEIEHLNAEALAAIAKLGKPVNPAPATIRMIQDKLLQKQFLAQANIPVAPFAKLNTYEDGVKLLKKFGGKMLIKTRHRAYDGRGNMVIENNADIKKALKHFKDAKLYAEAYVPFQKELAIMVARSMSGDIALYPVVETRHERNICVEVEVPAAITPKQQQAAIAVAQSVASLLEGAGVFGIELFLTKNGDILVNEIAPRVHNSGHYTMEACRTSQFEQHIRAISNLPLGDTSLTVPAAVMVNILGEHDRPTTLDGLDKVLSNPQTSIHIYGKSPTKVDRKMGHITATGKTIQEARTRARAARKQLSI